VGRLRLARKQKLVRMEATVSLVGRKLGAGNGGGWGSEEGHRVLLSFLEFWTFRPKWLWGEGEGEACEKNKKL
jgi:hypothetical protein